MGAHFLEEGERLIARPQGRMDAADGSDFASAVQQRLQPKTKSVTIDLEELDFISLGGIRAVLRLARSLKGDERSLDFERGSSSVREALHHAGLNNFFSFTPPYIHNGGHHR